MFDSINNYKTQITQSDSGDYSASNSPKSYDAQQDFDKSVFNINSQKLTPDAKKLWEKSFSDLDGDGKVSTGDFSQQELSMTNGRRTFLDYLSGIMGKPWKIAENVITNIKAMFIQSMPDNNIKNQETDELTDYIKSHKLKEGDSFVLNGITYNVGPGGTVSGDMSNTELKTVTYSDGVQTKSANMGDHTETDVYNSKGEHVRRTDYDDGSTEVIIYDKNSTSAYTDTSIRVRAPRTEDGVPFVSIRERN